MKITLKRLDGARFKAVNENGNHVILDGPPMVGGEGKGIRPMEMVLVGLAGCASMDVLLILQKGKHSVDDLQVSVEGIRADTVPAVFTEIKLHFTGIGDFSEEKLKRAVSLSMEKYCSVSKMLSSTATIHHSCSLSAE